MRVKKTVQVKSSPVDMEGAEGVKIRWLIGPDDSAPNFYMRQFALAPKGHTPLHVHEWEHEVYILEGTGVIVTSEGELSVEAGSCVLVESMDEHQFRNTGSGEMKFLCMIPTTGK